MNKNKVIIDGNSLTIENVYNISIKRSKVDFSQEEIFLKKLNQSRKFLE